VPRCAGAVHRGRSSAAPRCAGPLVHRPGCTISTLVRLSSELRSIRLL
jgi:hypothetical protein